MLARARPRTHFDQIDGLRAVAAVIVVLSHCCLRAEELDRPYGRLVYALRACVPVFFMISGFLLYRPMFRARWEGRATPSLRQYARRRLVRILPAYWLALTVVGVLFGTEAPGVFGRHWWVLYGFGQVYSGRTNKLGLGPAWTLCVDMSFYCVLPILSALCAAVTRWDRRRRASAARGDRPAWQIDVAVLGVLAIGSTVFRVWGQMHDATLSNTLPSTFAWFVPGMLFAVATVVTADRGAEALPRVLEWIAARPGTSWIIALALIVIDAAFYPLKRAFVYEGPISLGTYLTDDLLQLAIAVCIAAPAMIGAGRGGLTRRFLAYRPVMWIGVMSYGIYLFHYPLISYLEAHGVTRGPLPSLPSLFMVTLVISVAYGALSWYLVEKPFLNRFSSARARREA